MNANSKISRRHLLRLAGVTAAGAALAACATPTAQVIEKTVIVKETVQTEKIVEKVVAPTKAKIIKITMVPFGSTAIDSEYNQAGLDYRDIEPTISLEITAKQRAGGQEMIPWLASGTAPDFARDALNQGPTYGQKDLIWDVQPIATKMGVEKKYIPAVWSGFKLKGKVFEWPVDTNTLELFSNPVLFERAGLSNLLPPKNWEEMIKVCEAVTKPDADPKKAIFGYAIPTTIGWSGFFFWFWLWRHGGDFYDGEKILFNSDAAVEAINNLKMLIDKKYLPAFDNWQEPFYAGRCAMQEYGSWAIPSDIAGPWNNNTPTHKWEGDYPFPALTLSNQIELKKGIPGYSVFAGFGEYMPKTNKYPEETSKFIWWRVAHKTYGTIWLRLGNQLLPVGPDVVDHEWLHHPSWASFMKQLETTKPLLPWPEMLQANDQCLNPKTMAAWLGKMDPKKALQEAYDCSLPIITEAQKLA